MNTKTMKTKKGIKKTKEEPFVYGYKALNENLCASEGNGMDFKIGEIYEVEGELKFCRNGFHFCNNLEDTLNYYNPSENIRFIKIKAYGNVLSDSEGPKQLCRKIEIIEELSIKDILKALGLNEENFTEEEIFRKKVRVKVLLASKDLFLGTLINDENPYIRRAVAKQEYGLDTLINDLNPGVRIAVAKQGYGLDELINDKNPFVRLAVAEQKYGLGTLINDKISYVRRTARESLRSIKRNINKKNVAIK